MAVHPGGYNVTMGDGSVRVPMPGRSVSVAELATAFRRTGRAARAYTLGVQGPELRAALAQLHRQGVVLGLPSPRSAGGTEPVLLLVAEPGATQPGAQALLLLAAAGGAPTPLLLPAVQCAREAARRMLPNTPFEVVLVLRAPGSGTAAVSDQMALNFQHIRD